MPAPHLPDAGAVSRNNRLILRLCIAAALVVLALGYAREIAIRLLDVPPAAVGDRLFSLDSERNLPAWFTVLMLLGVSATMFRTTVIEFGQRRGTAWGWLLLAIGFVYLAVDEQMGLHERLAPLAEGMPDFGGIFHFKWVVVVLPILAIVGIAFIPFLLRLPRATALRLVMAGALYVGGALGIEMLGGVARSMGGHNIAYVLSATIEETLEIVGVLMALRAMLLHLELLRQTAAPGRAQAIAADQAS